MQAEGLEVVELQVVVEELDQLAEGLVPYVFGPVWRHKDHPRQVLPAATATRETSVAHPDLERWGPEAQSSCTGRNHYVQKWEGVVKAQVVAQPAACPWISCCFLEVVQMEEVVVLLEVQMPLAVAVDHGLEGCSVLLAKVHPADCCPLEKTPGRDSSVSVHLCVLHQKQYPCRSHLRTP